MTPREQALARIEERAHWAELDGEDSSAWLTLKAVLELHLVGISPTTGKEVCDFCSGYAEGHWHEIKSDCPTADLIIKGVL